MSDLYFRKKQQLSSDSSKVCVDACVELEKKRAQSPCTRSNSANPPPRIQRGKVAYSSELESVKEDTKKSLEELKNYVESVQKNIESSKAESLKNAINEIVERTNANISKLSDEIIKLQDALNQHESRLTSVEDIL